MDLRTGPAYLVGWGAHHPDGRLTNDALVARIDTSHAWLDEKVGIDERRVAGPEDTSASLGTVALEQALARAGAAASDLDLIIATHSVDDFEMPALAARVGDLVGSDAFGFDVGAACSGWLVGLDVADAMLATGRATTVAVVAAERATLGAHPDDRASVVFFGDGAGAAILRLDPPARGLEVVDRIHWSDNREHAAVTQPRGGSFAMDATATRTWVERAMVDAANALLDRNHLTATELRGLVGHQANLRLLERFAAALGVAPERHWHNVEWAGNTFSAGAPSALAEALDREASDLHPGDPILVVTVGAGLNVVATLLRWTAT
jgi:3-oxoacyl-[acyl-carrier-protein] synthase-3